MGTEGGPGLRRIGVSGETAASLVATLAEVQGYEVCAPGPEVCLHVQEVAAPDRLVSVGTCPTVAVVLRRVRLGERAAFREAGARWILDAEASLSELAGVVVDHLFDGISQARRHARRFGGRPVQLQPEGGENSIGRLQCLTRRVAEVATDAVVPVGTAVRVLLSASGRPVPLVGRVAWSDEGRGIGLELMEPGAPIRSLRG